MSRSKTAPEPRQGDTESLLLDHAADLILKSRRCEVDIEELADRSGVPRSTIYTHFGQPIKEAILTGIFERFFSHTSILIKGALTVDAKASSSIERLAAVFRGALTAFKRNERFGKVVLSQLNLKRSEAKPIFAIFSQADALFAEARKAGQLSPEAAERLADWKIRQIMFVVAHGLLRALYLKEGLPPDRPAGRGVSVTFSEADVEIEVLRVLQIYCSEDAAGRIHKTIEALKTQKSA